MAGTHSETSLDFLFGGCVSRKAVVQGPISQSVSLHDAAVESAHESFCSADLGVQLEDVWGKLCSFGTSERETGWLLILNLIPMSTNWAVEIASISDIVQSKSVLLRFVVLGGPLFHVDGTSSQMPSRGWQEQRLSVSPWVEEKSRPARA